MMEVFCLFVQEPMTLDGITQHTNQLFESPKLENWPTEGRDHHAYVNAVYWGLMRTCRFQVFLDVVGIIDYIVDVDILVPKVVCMLLQKEVIKRLSCLHFAERFGCRHSSQSRFHWYEGTCVGFWCNQ